MAIMNDDMQRRKEVYDTEMFKIIETALRMQGVPKPLTDEFYSSVIEATDYAERLATKARIDENIRWIKHCELPKFMKGVTSVTITDLIARNSELQDALVVLTGKAKQ